MGLGGREELQRPNTSGNIQCHAPNQIKDISRTKYKIREKKSMRYVKLEIRASRNFVLLAERNLGTSSGDACKNAESIYYYVKFLCVIFNENLWDQYIRP